jgi:hypothetical protein
MPSDNKEFLDLEAKVAEQAKEFKLLQSQVERALDLLARMAKLAEESSNRTNKLEDMVRALMEAHPVVYKQLIGNPRTYPNKPVPPKPTNPPKSGYMTKGG